MKPLCKLLNYFFHLAIICTRLTPRSNKCTNLHSASPRVISTPISTRLRLSAIRWAIIIVVTSSLIKFKHPTVVPKSCQIEQRNRKLVDFSKIMQLKDYFMYRKIMKPKLSHISFLHLKFDIIFIITEIYCKLEKIESVYFFKLLNVHPRIKSNNNQA